MTLEHYVGRALLSRPVTFGINDELDGRELPINAFGSHLLCEGHNNDFSPVDAEAIRLQQAIATVLAPDENDWNDSTDGEDALWTPQRVVVDGTRFSRWLCKIYGNFSALRGNTPDIDYVRHAFGWATETPVRVHFRAELGEEIRYQRRIFFYSFITSIEGQVRDIFYVYFMGIGILVTPFDLTDEFLNELEHVSGSNYFSTGDWMPELRELRHEQERIGITRTLQIDWGA